MTEYFYPEQMGRIILLAMEEVIGRDGVCSVLDQSSLASYADEYPARAPKKLFRSKRWLSFKNRWNSFTVRQADAAPLYASDAPAFNMVCVNMVPCLASPK